MAVVAEEATAAAAAAAGGAALLLLFWSAARSFGVVSCEATGAATTASPMGVAMGATVVFFFFDTAPPIVKEDGKDGEEGKERKGTEEYRVHLPFGG